jgi:hypothetical protein
LGDGIFALFGAPLAHEDHPQRALYAALRMQEAMRRYADTLRAKSYPPLLMRVGINTGEVVLRSIRKDDLHADYVPVGHSTNLAARMEQLAAPGSILITAYTHRLTDGYFAFKDLGQTQIKGVEEPFNIYEALGAGPLRTRLQVSARHGLTRFVGRQSELEQLQRALEQTKAGHGQIVGVIGEPGLGKSRLFHEFVEAPGRHWSQFKGNSLVFPICAARLGSFPPCGGRSGRGETGHAPLNHPLLNPPPSRGRREKPPTCGLSCDRRRPCAVPLRELRLRRILQSN